MIENLNSGGFQWDEKCLATDGTVVCLRRCAWLQGKVKRGGFSFKFCGKSEGKGDTGTVASQWIFSFEFG